MSESFIEPSSLNTTFQSLSAIIDDGGATRFLNSELSSYNFDGFIPQETDTIAVSLLKVGNSFLAPGDSLGTLRTVLKIEFDDPEMTDSPTTNYIISYLGDGGEVQSVVYDATDEVEIYYEDWDNKVLGSNGWIITQAGNAIFSNVAIRGRIEATEGFIDGDLTVTGSLATSETASATGGVVFGSTGILAYDTNGNNTFFLDSSNGDITIFGTPGDDLLTGGDVADDGTTVISGNRITTGSVTGRVFRSNSTMTPTSGDGVYLDGSGNVRFRNSNATLTFNSTGLSLSGAGLTIGGTDPNNFLEAVDVGSSGTTTISGNRITTGVIDSAGYGGVTDGSVFAPGGMAINVDNGTITAKEFRIDAAGNAHFSGDLSAAGGTFSGALNAGISITSPVITGGTITGSTLNSATSGQRVSIASSQINLIGAGGSTGGIVYGSDVAVLIAGTTSAYLYAPTRIAISNSFIVDDYYMTGGLLYGSGAQLSSLNATNISSGTLNANRLPFTMNQNVGTANSPTFASISALTTQGSGQGTHYLHWNSSGGTVTRSTSLPSGSSRKLKTDIQVFEVNPLWTASVSNIYTFKYKSDVEDLGENAPTQVGVIIDEISYIPEISNLIFEVNSASAIDYTKFGVLLIPTINYLIEKINQQQELIEDLETRMIQLESQIGE